MVFKFSIQKGGARDAGRKHSFSIVAALFLLPLSNCSCYPAPIRRKRARACMARILNSVGHMNSIIFHSDFQLSLSITPFSRLRFC